MLSLHVALVVHVLGPASRMTVSMASVATVSPVLFAGEHPAIGPRASAAKAATTVQRMFMSPAQCRTTGRDSVNTPSCR